jgi:hypothetical protein
MRLLWSCLEQYGRPVAFHTDKASHFQTAEKRKRDEPGVENDAVEMPPTQIGRALQELGIVWIGAHRSGIGCRRAVTFRRRLLTIPSGQNSRDRCPLHLQGKKWKMRVPNRPTAAGSGIYVNPDHGPIWAKQPCNHGSIATLAN